MNNSHNDVSKDFAESEVAQDVTSRVLEIEDTLNTLDSKYSRVNPLLIRIINNCCFHYDQIKFLNYCDVLLPSVRKMETKLAKIRLNVAKLEDRLATIDHRRTNAKSHETHRNLLTIIVKSRHLIKDYEAILTSWTEVVVDASKSLKTIKEDMIYIESVAFAVVHYLKRYRRELIAERTKLLDMKNALQDKD